MESLEGPLTFTDQLRPGSEVVSFAYDRQKSIEFKKQRIRSLKMESSQKKKDPSMEEEQDTQSQTIQSQPSASKSHNQIKTKHENENPPVPTFADEKEEREHEKEKEKEKIKEQQQEQEEQEKEEEEEEEEKPEEIEQKNQAVRRYIAQLGIFIPGRIVSYYIGKAKELPDKVELKMFSEQFDGAVLFADISGFSVLAEELESNHKNRLSFAATSLSNEVGAALEPLVKMILEWGGDVIKFAGDAMFAVFSASTHGNMENAVAAACLVARKTVKFSLYNLVTGVKLKVHCGVGAGKILGLHVGGVANRWEYAITGEAVSQTISAEHDAVAGEVAVSSKVQEFVAQFIETEPIEGSNNFKLLSMLGEELGGTTIRTKRFGDELAAFDAKTLVKVYKHLIPYIPRPVIESVDKGIGVSLAAVQWCATLFIKLNGLPHATSSDVLRIHNIVRMIQSQLFAFEGATMCRLIVDDKGLTTLWAFGMSKSSKHLNFAFDAVASALLLNEELHSKGLSCSVGITAGRVFCGTVGGSQRSEYTLHGTQVNLAARLMGKAGDGVLCDESIYIASLSLIEYDEPFWTEVKGKKKPIQVYRPRRIFEESLGMIPKAAFTEDVQSKSTDISSFDVLLEKARKVETTLAPAASTNSSSSTSTTTTSTTQTTSTDTSQSTTNNKTGGSEQEPPPPPPPPPTNQNSNPDFHKRRSPMRSNSEPISNLETKPPLPAPVPGSLSTLTKGQLTKNWSKSNLQKPQKKNSRPSLPTLHDEESKMINENTNNNNGNGSSVNNSPYMNNSYSIYEDKHDIDNINSSNNDRFDSKDQINSRHTSGSYYSSNGNSNSNNNSNRKSGHGGKKNSTDSTNSSSKNKRIKSIDNNEQSYEEEYENESTQGFQSPSSNSSYESKGKPFFNLNWLNPRLTLTKYCQDCGNTANVLSKKPCKVCGSKVWIRTTYQTMGAEYSKICADCQVATRKRDQVSCKVCGSNRWIVRRHTDHVQPAIYKEEVV